MQPVSTGGHRLAGTRSLAACAALLASALLSACSTTSGTGGNTVRTLDGTYQAPQSTALPTDIRQILAAGGLDATDPSAPTNGTAVAEMATSTSRDVEKATQLAQTLSAGQTAPLALAARPEKAAPAPVVVASVPDPAPATFVYPDIGKPAEAAKADPVTVASTPPPRKRAPRPVAAAAKPTPAPEKAQPEPKRPRRF